MKKTNAFILASRFRTAFTSLMRSPHLFIYQDGTVSPATVDLLLAARELVK